jgi:hypothetical protein
VNEHLLIGISWSEGNGIGVDAVLRKRLLVVSKGVVRAINGSGEGNSSGRIEVVRWMFGDEVVLFLVGMEAGDVEGGAWGGGVGSIERGRAHTACAEAGEERSAVVCLGGHGGLAGRDYWENIRWAGKERIQRQSGDESIDKGNDRRKRRKKEG